MAASSGEHSASGSVGCASGDETACSTPFVSAPSSPACDPSFSAAGCFYSAPASPGYGCELGFDFDFSSRCPSPAAPAMSSADELFHNGQIRPMRLASFLLRPQVLPPLDDGDVPSGNPPPPEPAPAPAPVGADERGRLRSRSVHRRYRSLSPFRAHRLSPPPPSPAPAAKSLEPAAAAGEAAPSAPRSSSSSSTASSASSSSSSSRSCRRWGFLKVILHRSKSDGGEHSPRPSNLSPPPAPAPAPRRDPASSPAASRGRGRARWSVHARLYEARRAEAEEKRRRTFLPYRQGLLLGCLGLGSRGYGAMHGLAAAAGKARSTVTHAVPIPTTPPP